MTETSTFYWHIHHRVLLEAATEPIENRIAYIRDYKPADEVEARLRLLKPVAGVLPLKVVEEGVAYNKAGVAYNKARVAYNKAWTALNKALAAYDKARAAYDKAWTALNKALAAHKGEIEALHRVECPDCPWDGQTIFPDKKEI